MHTHSLLAVTTHSMRAKLKNCIHYVAVAQKLPTRAVTKTENGARESLRHRPQ